MNLFQHFTLHLQSLTAYEYVHKMLPLIKGKLPQSFLKTQISIKTRIIIHKITTMVQACNLKLTVQPGVQ